MGDYFNIERLWEKEREWTSSTPKTSNLKLAFIKKIRMMRKSQGTKEMMMNQEINLKQLSLVLYRQTRQVNYTKTRKFSSRGIFRIFKNHGI